MRIIKIAIPVPYQEEWEQIINDKGYPKSYDYLNEEIEDDVQSKVEDKYPNAKPISGGSFGLTYDVGNDRILKITYDQTEIVKANKLKENPSDLYVKVYDFGQLQENVFYVVAEKVKLLSSQEDNIYTEFWDNYRIFMSFMSSRRSFLKEEDIWVDFTNALDKHGVFNNSSNLEFFNRLTNFVKKLNDEGTSWFTSDLHADNIGYNKNDEFIILDLGGLNSNNGKPLTKRLRKEPKKNKKK